MFSKNVVRAMALVFAVVVAFGFLFLQPTVAKAESEPINITMGDPIHLEDEGILRVPVFVDKDLTGMGITSMQTDVEIVDTSVITLERVMMTVETMVKGNNFYSNPNTGRDGYVRVTWSNYVELKGQGLLFYLDFRVLGNPGDISSVMLQSFAFYNGEGVSVNVTNRDIVIPSGSFTVQGRILYLGREDRPVGFDSFQAVDSSGIHILDASSGFFTYETQGGLTSFSGSKDPQLCTLQQNVITPRDGALLLACTVGLIECDMEVADVWADQWLSAFDAGLVMWCASGVQYPLQSALGTFVFDPMPEEIEVAPDKSIDLSVKMRGDLSGNYGQSEVAMASIASSVPTTTSYNQVVEISSDAEFFTIDFTVDGNVVVPETYGDWTFAQNNGHVVGVSSETTTHFVLPIMTDSSEISIFLDNLGASTFQVSPRTGGVIYLPSLTK